MPTPDPSNTADTARSRMTPFPDDVDEVSAQRLLFAEFNDARAAGDKAEAVRIARQFLSYAWEGQPLAAPSFAMRLFLERADEAKREKDGHDNVAVLLKCLSGEWRYDLAVSTLSEIDRLKSEGWTIGPDDREVIEKARSRCREHEKARRREEKWRQMCADLAEAVKRSDVKSIKNILSAREFRYREPEDETIVWKAERVLRGRGNRTMRRFIMPATVGITALVALFIFLGRRSHERDFDQRRAAEAEKLDALMKMYDPIEQLSSELAYLRAEEPDLLADHHISSYVGTLAKMREDNLVRTNEIVSLLVELEGVAASSWEKADASTIDKIERVDGLLLPHDVEFSIRLLKIKEAALEHSRRKKDNGANLSRQYAARLTPILDSLARRLDTDLPDGELHVLTEKCVEALGKWDRDYAKDAKDADANLAAPRRRFEGALRRQTEAVKALEDFKSAMRAMDVVSLRQSLREKHSAYGPIASLGPLPYGEDEVRELLGNLSERVVVDDGDEDDMRPLRAYRAVTAGKIMFDPLGKLFARDPSAIAPQVASGVDRNAPLYILRPEDGNLVLRRALVMRNGKWGITTRVIRKELLLGEPLFQVK